MDVARRAGVSVNTVRLYEEWGYLPPVPRASNGYRQFEERHVQHVLLVRQAMRCTWIGGRIRQITLQILTTAAQGDYRAAQTHAASLLELLHAEQAHAEEAIQVLEQWVIRRASGGSHPRLRIGDMAKRLHVSIDELRSWERNGLLDVPRAPNGYRLYGTDETDRLLVIRTLRRARYSTMAILRLMQFLDDGQTDHLRDVINTPPPDAENYPTDSWLSTLETMQQAAESMRDILQTLHKPTRVL